MVWYIIRLTAQGKMYELAEYQEGSGGRWVIHFSDLLTLDGKVGGMEREWVAIAAIREVLDYGDRYVDGEKKRVLCKCL